MRITKAGGLLVLCGLIWLTSTLPGAWANESAAAPPRLLIVGDSLSDAYRLPREAGWVALLSERLQGEVEVINGAISGETTAGGVTRLPALLDQFEPRWVLIILGGNDGLRALAPSQLATNLSTMVDQAQQAGAAVALMQVRMPANLGPVYQRRFEAVYPQVAEDHDVVLLPFFLQDIFDQPGMLMDDGIHPTAEAQPLMLEALWEGLLTFMQAGQSDNTRVSLDDD